MNQRVRTLWGKCGGQTSSRRTTVRLRLWSLEDRLLPAAAITPAFTPEVQVSSSQTQNFPDVGVAGTGAYTGTFDVVYQQTSGTTSTVLVKRYNADGTPLAAALGPNTITVDTSNVADPMQRIAVRADGSFVVVYRQASGTPNVETIAAKIYNADGSLRNTVPSLASSYESIDKTMPAVAVQDATGIITATWVATNTMNHGGVFFRRLDAGGGFLSPADAQLFCAPPPGSLAAIRAVDGISPAVDVAPAPLGSGMIDAVITVTDAPSNGIEAIRLDSSGKGLDRCPFAVNKSGTKVSHSRVALDAEGEFVVAWEDDSGPVANILMHRFDKNGASQSPGNADEVVDNSPNGDKTVPSVARADDGRFIVSFRDNALMGEAMPPNQRIAYRQFARDGAPVGMKRTLATFAVPGANPAAAASGSGVFAIAADQDPSGMGHFDTFARTFREQPPTLFAVASAPNQVTVYRVADGSVYGTLTPFTAYNGGVTVAWGDVNGDGYPDLVVAATAGNPAIKVYNGNFIANFASTFFAQPDDYLLGRGFVYGLNLNIGVSLAVGDVEGNGFADIVTAPTTGNPHVKVFSGKQISNGGVIPFLPQPPHAFNPDGDPAVVAQGFVYGLNFNVGANVAVADIEGNGRADVITGASAGNPHVKVYSGQQVIALGVIGTLGPNTADAGLRTSFFAYPMGLNIGAFVAAGDVDGDGVPDLVTGASAGNPQVRVFRGADLRSGAFNPDVPQSSLVDNFFAYELGMNVGVSVGATDFDGDGLADIVTGSVNRTPVLYRVFKTNPDHTHTTLLNGIQGSPPGATGDLGVGVENLQNSRF